MNVLFRAHPLYFEEEIRRVLEQFDNDEEEREVQNIQTIGDDIDGSDIDGEQEVVEVNDCDSCSEVSQQETDDMEVDINDDFFFLYWKRQ